MNVKYVKRDIIKMEIYKNICEYTQEKNLLRVNIVQFHLEHHLRFEFFKNINNLQILSCQISVFILLM